jgi:DNA-binding transcriptional ArsR family regulator
MLGQKPKQKVIREAIRGELRRGKLAPGDRLTSVKDLCARFSAGQRTVQEALRGLEEEGLIEVRDRSGSYVREDALENVEMAGKGGGSSVSTPAGDLRSYMMPQRSGDGTIRLYVTDLEPRRLALWREVLDGFPGATVEVVSCNEGHLEDVFDSGAPDVVETTPGVLDAVGMEKFLPGEALRSLAGIEPDRMIAPVRRRMASGRPMGGAPFSVTLQYLFVNQDLAERARIEQPPSDPEAFLREVRRAQGELAESAAEAFVLPTCLDLLLMTGAISWEKGGGLQFDPERARSLLEGLNACAPPAVESAEAIERFCRGELLYLIHCSFMISEFVGQLPFRWKALPLPLAPGVRMPGWLSVLAVSRDASRPGQCAELVGYLSGTDVQSRFTEVPGNLPVRGEVTGAVEATTGGSLSVETLRRSLSQLTLGWPEAARAAIECSFSVPELREALSRGALRVEDGVERLGHRLDIVWDRDCEQLAGVEDSVFA